MKCVHKAALTGGRGGDEWRWWAKGGGLNIERQVSGRSEGMVFPAEPVLMEYVTTESRDTVSD